MGRLSPFHLTISEQYSTTDNSSTMQHRRFEFADIFLGARFYNEPRHSKQKGHRPRRLVSGRKSELNRGWAVRWRHSFQAILSHSVVSGHQWGLYQTSEGWRHSKWARSTSFGAHPTKHVKTTHRLFWSDISPNLLKRQAWKVHIFLEAIFSSSSEPGPSVLQNKLDCQPGLPVNREGRR